MEHHAIWKPDIFAGTALAASALFYVIGLSRMFARNAPPPRLEVVAFIIGWLTLALALVSRTATLCEYFLTVHMPQPELLRLVGAPLLAIARPIVPMLRALPRRWRRHDAATSAAGSVLRLASSPSFVFLLHAVALWVWRI